LPFRNAMTATIPSLPPPLPAGLVPAGEGDAAARATPVEAFGAVLARLAAEVWGAEVLSGTDTPETAAETDEEEAAGTTAISGPVPPLPQAVPVAPPAVAIAATPPAPALAAADASATAAAAADVAPPATDEPPARPAVTASEATGAAGPAQGAPAARAAAGTQAQARPAPARPAVAAEGKPACRVPEKPEKEVLTEVPDGEETTPARPVRPHIQKVSMDGAPEPARAPPPPGPANAAVAWPPAPSAPPHGAETAAPAPVTARPAAQPEPPARQLAPIAIALAVDGAKGTERLTVTLDPAELGRVEVRVERASDAGPASIRVLAERPETLALLQRDGQELQRALDQAGIRTAPEGLSFDLGGGGNSGGTADTGGGGRGEPRPGTGAGRDGGGAPGGGTSFDPAPPRPLTLLDIAV
jgi:hypothetical protein